MAKKTKIPDGWNSLPWFKPDKDAAKEPLPEMTTEEFFEISRALEDCHAVFYKFWEVGKPRFTRAISTACVGVDKKTGHPVCFLFNPEFWAWLDDYSRLFVIAHEMVHLILRHGLRAKDCKEQRLANDCLDVIINHLLVDKFGFERRKVKAANKVCWRDTLFDDSPHYKGPKVKADQNFEYYYLLAKKYFEFPPRPPRVLAPGMIVWNKKSKSWGRIKSVGKDTIDVKPLNRKDAVKACKEEYRQAANKAAKLKEAVEVPSGNLAGKK